MKIVVLVKQVPDPCCKAGMKEDGTVDREGAPPVLNPFDRHALEMALQLRDIHGGTISVLSMGPPAAGSAITECFTMGADDGVLLTDKRAAGSDTLATAYALSKCFGHELLTSPDILICGMQSSDGDTAHIGPQIAERLGLPQATYVESIDLTNGRATVGRIIEGGIETLELPMPLVISVAPTANDPRAPSLKASLKAKSKKVTVINADDAGIEPARIGRKGSPTWVTKVTKIGPPSRQGVLVDDIGCLAGAIREIVGGDGQ